MSEDERKNEILTKLKCLEASPVLKEHEKAWLRQAQEYILGRSNNG